MAMPLAISASWSSPGKACSITTKSFWILEFHRDLHDRRKHDENRPVLFAGIDLPREGLHDLGGLHEPVEVLQDKDRRALWRGQGIDRPDRRQGVGTARVG